MKNSKDPSGLEHEAFRLEGVKIHAKIAAGTYGVGRRIL